MKKFFKSFGSFFKKLNSKAPSWNQTASRALAVAAPLTNTVVVLTAGEKDAVEVSRVMAEVQANLKTASDLMEKADGGADVSAELKHTLDSITANLDGLLTAGHIKNLGTRQKVQLAVSTLAGEVETIAALIPQKPQKQ